MFEHSVSLIAWKGVQVVLDTYFFISVLEDIGICSRKYSYTERVFIANSHVSIDHLVSDFLN